MFVRERHFSDNLILVIGDTLVESGPLVLYLRLLKMPAVIAKDLFRFKAQEFVC